MTDLTPEEETRLREHVAALPESIEPEQDLWPEIRARIEAARVRSLPVTATHAPAVPHAPREAPAAQPAWTTRTPWLRLLAAAAVLVVASVSLTMFVMTRRGDGTGSAGGAIAARDDSGTRALATFVSYERSASELAAALQRRSIDLDPATREVLERSLRTIDDAIEEARGALAADPASATMRSFVDAAYRQKLDFLRRANDVAALRGA